MELFKILGRIAVDNDEANENLDETSDKASTLGEKLKSGLATAAKVGAAAVTAASTVVVALAKNSIQAYADYEQLVGGVETLFNQAGMSWNDYAAKMRESGQMTVDNAEEIYAEYEKLAEGSKIVQENAANAFRTAGMSANEYMETVTSFSASLLKGLNGDTVAAAEYADMAITDMADNANKMGTSMELIQNAYQGLAKGNATMLDNLKLGYGGTQTEMLQLAKDMGVVEDSIESFGDMSFDEAVLAIHNLQDEMGITGTTAKEASSTITGSLSAAKAAWQNMLVGIADEESDFEGLVDNLVTSVSTVADNIMPRITTALGGIGLLITSLAPLIIEQLPPLISTLVPELVNAAMSIINALTAAFPSLVSALLPGLLSAIGQIIPSLIMAIIEFVPVIIDTGVQLLGQLATGLANGGPQLFQTITDIIIQLVNTLTSPETLISLIDSGIQLIVSLVEGIVDAIPQLLHQVPIIIANIVSVLMVELPNIITAGIEIVFALIDGIIECIPELVAAIPNLIIGIVNGLINNLDRIILAAPEIILALISGIIGAIPSLVMAIPQVIMSIVETFRAYDWGGVGKNIITNIKTGFLNMWSDFVSSVSSKFESIVTKIKGFFNFEWSLPKLKLPHFKQTGTTALGLPKIGIEWYAKGGVMEEPTAFGINPNSGKVMVGGEAGAEAIAPIDTLQSYVSEAVASQNAILVAILEKILDAILTMDENMGGNLREALDGTSFNINNREFARLVKAVG